MPSAAAEHPTVHARMDPDATATWPLPVPYDFFETTRFLRTGRRDPTVVRRPDGLLRAAHTPEGPATVRLVLAGSGPGASLAAEAWGPGARAALAAVPLWTGIHEAAWVLPSHPVTDRLLRQHRGLRTSRTDDVFEALVNAVLQQLVTWNEAAMLWRRLAEALGSPAPGPFDLRLSPTPEAVRSAGAARLVSLGVRAPQARTLVEVARRAPGLAQAVTLPTDEAAALLESVPGVGSWTASLVLGMRLGRPEPLPLGDFHMPSVVAWALAGEPRGSDRRMQELLAAFPGQASRVVRLLLAARITAPRYGPKREWRRVPR